MTPTHPLLHNQLKRRLASDEVSLCLRSTLVRTPELAWLARAAGFDALYVDLEHSGATLEQASQICLAGAAAGVTPLVRLASPTSDTVVPLLDAGCQGIIAPQVETAEQARAVVASAKFPPMGSRSACGTSVALAYQAVGVGEMARLMNEETLVAVMVESRAGIRNAAEIAAVDGVDMLLVGTFDLTLDLGIPGQHEHPDIEEAYRAVAEACQGRAAFGVAGMRDTAAFTHYVELGARFVSAGRDLDLLLAGARSRVDELRALAGATR